MSGEDTFLTNVKAEIKPSHDEGEDEACRNEEVSHQRSGEFETDELTNDWRMN